MATGLLDVGQEALAWLFSSHLQAESFWVIVWLNLFQVQEVQ